MTKTKTKKTIITKDELQLAEHLGFRGKYVASLLEAAAKHLQIEGDSPFQDAKGYLNEIAKRHAESVKARWGISVRKHNLLTKKAISILRSFSTGYSMGELKRLFVDGEVFCTVDNCREYSGRCKFRAQHGELNIHLKMHELRAIERIEGVWTVRCKGTKANWLQSKGLKGSYRVSLVAGHLVGTSHGATVAECESLERGKAIDRDDGAFKISTKFVGFQDRNIAGACEAGVLAFCQRHNLDPQMGYRLDYLVSLDDLTALPYLAKISRKLAR